MGLNDYIVSVIRTVVPTAVGAALTYLAALAGIVLDETASAGAVMTVTAIVIGLYYAGVRLLEARFPQLGYLLGAPKPPTYTPPPAKE